MAVRDQLVRDALLVETALEGMGDCHGGFLPGVGCAGTILFI
jgi:hypothetical protein